MQRVKIQEHLAEKWFFLPYSPWVSINTVRFVEQKVLGIFFSLSTTYMVPQKNIFSFSFHVHYSPNRAHFSRKSSQHSPLHEEGGGGTKSFFSLLGKKSEKENDITEERRKTKKRGKQNLPVMHWPKEEEKKNPGDEEEDVDEKRQRRGTGK